MLGRYQREKNKELEARNRELERRLREEQALREASQAKLKALKKKGRDEKNASEVEEENGAQKNQQQRKVRGADSPDKTASKDVETKKVASGNATKQGTEPSAAKQSGTAKSTGTRPGTPKVASKNEQALKPGQGSAKKSDAARAESTIAEKNLAELDAKKSVPAQKQPKQANDEKPVPAVSNQGTAEKVDNNLGKPMGQGQVAAPGSPVRPKMQPVNIAKEDPAQKSTPQQQNGAQNAAPLAASLAVASEAKLNGKQSTQRPTNGGPKIPSAIEFDPLKTTPPSEVNIPVDANGTPVDMQSLSSANGGAFSSADVGLGNFSIHNQFSQPYDVAASLFGHSGMAVPLVGFAPATGIMSYQPTNGPYHQGAAMMQVAQQPFSQQIGDETNGAMSSNVSLLQQPFLQVSDAQSIHSMPMADLSQPMILIQPQHVRGVSMHDYSADTMIRNPGDSMPSTNAPMNQAHLSRGNSMHTFPNSNASWNQNTQWSQMPSNSIGLGQQPASAQQQVQPADPFDELVSRRPMSAMSSNGK